MTNKSKFVLKLSGVDLQNIKAGDIGRLLNDFCKLLGDDYLYFDDIYSGSAVLKVSTEPEYYNIKLEKLNENIVKQASALEDINKVLRGYAKNFSDIDASIFASRTAVNDDDMILIHHIDYHKPLASTFKQTETFIGRLEKPAHGKDDTDHFTIKLATDKEISVAVPKNLSDAIAPYLTDLWNFDSLLKFVGTAHYELEGSYHLNLKNFEAKDFEIISNTTSAKRWINSFVSKGDSGWNKLENPINTWLEERHL